LADLIVRGSRPVSGLLNPSGNKNAVLPILCATLLSPGRFEISNVPDISDVEKLLDYFASCGSFIERDRENNRVVIKHSFHESERDLVSLPTGIRSAVLLLAPTVVSLRRLKFDTEAKGCALGIREIDPHLAILSGFGCSILETRPYTIRLDGHHVGQEIWADYASVTATETFVMMAASAKGRSVLTNAASEPHVQALCHFLEKMGAQISGIGTSMLTIEGTEDLFAADFSIPDDHHEVATFLAIGGVTNGHITVETDVGPHMPLIVRQFSKLGLNIDSGPNSLSVRGWSRNVDRPYTQELIPKIEAAPWPYFPADLLPQAIGVAVGCTQEVMFWNKVYEGALGWSGELSKFGAKVLLADPHRLVVFGGSHLRPAVVEAPYIIRVVLGLFIAALQIDGESVIRNADPIRRAHPRFVEKLKAMGADVEWA
jgi:UDP-N-acetylglucosamine 1-carboxyvinyltransferase